MVKSPLAGRVCKLLPAFALLLAALTGCTDPAVPGTKPAEAASAMAVDDAAAGMEAATESLSKAMSDAFQSGRAITDRRELASHLSLPEDRLKTIGTAAPAALQPAASAAVRRGFFCGPSGCVCVGDSDCNNLFSTVCRSPARGGACRMIGRLVVCTCPISRAP